MVISQNVFIHSLADGFFLNTIANAFIIVLKWTYDFIYSRNIPRVGLAEEQG